MIITPMLNPSNLFLPLTPIRPGTLFLVARRYAVRALARGARSAVVQLELDARLGWLRRADAGHGAGRSTVGGRRCIVEVLPFGVICRLLSELVDEGVLRNLLVNGILHAKGLINSPRSRWHHCRAHCRPRCIACNLRTRDQCLV
jgi:hypothetical protein